MDAAGRLPDGGHPVACPVPRIARRAGQGNIAAERVGLDHPLVIGQMFTRALALAVGAEPVLGSVPHPVGQGGALNLNALAGQHRRLPIERQTICPPPPGRSAPDPVARV